MERRTTVLAKVALPFYLGDAKRTHPAEAEVLVTQLDDLVETVRRESTRYRE